MFHPCVNTFRTGILCCCLLQVCPTSVLTTKQCNVTLNVQSIAHTYIHKGYQGFNVTWSDIYLGCKLMSRTGLLLTSTRNQPKNKCMYSILHITGTCTTVVGLQEGTTTNQYAHKPIRGDDHKPIHGLQEGRSRSISSRDEVGVGLGLGLSGGKCRGRWNQGPSVLFLSAFLVTDQLMHPKSGAATGVGTLLLACVHSNR